MKYLALLLLVFVPAEAARIECVRWTWTGDVFERKVVCLEWRDRDAPKKDEKKKKTT
jgi:hypothetical protein